MGLDGGTKITRSDVLRRQSSRWAQQDTSRSTRGGSVSHIYQERQLDEQTRRNVLWTTCALSGLPLVAPIVADALGQLFNRQSVLEHLLAAKAAAAPAAAAPAATVAQPTGLLTAPVAGNSAGSIVPYSGPAPAAAAAPAPPKELAAACLRRENQQRAAAAAAAAAGDAAQPQQGLFDHLKSLKDVFTVQLTVNADLQQQQHPAAANRAGNPLLPLQSAKAEASSSRGDSTSSGALPSPWMCPVTLLPCGSKQPFCALRPCGHVISQKALAAITPAATKAAAAAAGNTLVDGSGSSKQAAAAGVGLHDDTGSVDACCCPVCETAFDPATDQVLINGSAQHMDAVREQLKAAAAAKAAAKQHKKRKRQDANERPAACKQLLLEAPGHTVQSVRQST